jgi:hypothetical protein
MMDFSARMSGCTIFSTDLRKGFHHIPIHAKDTCKAAILTPFGLYEFLHMGFDLCNAGNTFQCMMDCVASGMPFIFVYLEDIIVGSRDIQSHIHHILPSHYSTQEKAGLVILCDTSQGRPRPVVPSSHRRLIFTAMHEMAYPGIRETCRLVAHWSVWKSMLTDVAA